MATAPLTSDTATLPPDRVVEFPDTADLNRILIDLCGEFDRNLAQIEHQVGVQILRRGNQLAIHGMPEAQAEAQGPS